MKGNLRGDLLVACSALFYSLHVVRLGKRRDKTFELAFRLEWPDLCSTSSRRSDLSFLSGQTRLR